MKGIHTAIAANTAAAISNTTPAINEKINVNNIVPNDVTNIVVKIFMSSKFNSIPHHVLVKLDA